MTATAPEPGGPAAGPGGGSFLTRRYGGIPAWVYLGVFVGGGVGVWLWRKHQAASSSSTTSTSAATGCTDANGNPVDCNSSLAVGDQGQAEYEQLNADLTGLSGQDAAILSAINDTQGSASTGSGTKTVPRVTGDTPAAAKSKILAAGFKYEQSPANPRSGEVVRSQDPTGGAKAKTGSTVRVGLGAKARGKTPASAAG